jgi:LytS/YehU family sensor histidine kinase
MRSRIIKIAVLTSPIIAAYGIAPIFLLQTFVLREFIIAFVSLTLFIGSFWCINIYLNFKVTKPIIRYLISYLLTFILQFIVLNIIPNVPEHKNSFDFLLYSLASTIAINTIIVIIINSELVKNQRNLAEIENKALKLANLEAQKQVLLQQLQPHFLFNALSTIKSLISENTDLAEEYVINLSEFLRYSVHANENDLIPLKDEWQFTQDFFNLQKVRFGDALQWECDIQQDDLKKLIPVLSLQLLVENAIKHNSFTTKNPLLINISSSLGSITVSNKKSPKEIVIKSGVGLKNLISRYDIFTNQGIQILNGNEVFKVTLKLLENESSNN